MARRSEKGGIPVFGLLDDMIGLLTWLTPRVKKEIPDRQG